MKTRRGKLTRRDQELLAHVRRAQARKVPFAQYCRTNGLKVQSVYNLRSRLAHSHSTRRQVRVSKEEKRAGKFIAVRVASTMAPSVTACRLQRKGWVIECASLPPPAWLAGLMTGDCDAAS